MKQRHMHLPVHRPPGAFQSTKSSVSTLVKPGKASDCFWHQVQDSLGLSGLCIDPDSDCLFSLHHFGSRHTNHWLPAPHPS